VGYSADTNGVWHKAEDIRGGVFGLDESTQEFYFLNKVGFMTQTPTHELTVNGGISTKTLYDYDDNLFFIDPNGNSVLKDVDFKSITINGIIIDNLYVNENQVNSISSVMIVDGTITISDLGNDSVGASELVAIYESGLAFDYRFINTAGDTMTGDLNLGDNAILGVNTISTGFGANELYPMDQAVLTTSDTTFSSINTGFGANELYPMNQAVLTTSGTTFSSINTGFGSNELYPMNQAVLTTSGTTFSSINTGFGANELYPMNQNVLTGSSVTFSSINTGFGANELFAMNQNVLTTSNPTFNNVNSNGILYVNEIRPKSGSSVTIKLT
jgi:hypothetical protein